MSTCALFDELWNGSPVRLLGIRTSKLVKDSEPVQLSMFDLATQKPVSEKQRKLDAALDTIRSRYGSDAIKRGSLISSPVKTPQDQS